MLKYGVCKFLEELEVVLFDKKTSKTAKTKNITIKYQLLTVPTTNN